MNVSDVANSFVYRLRAREKDYGRETGAGFTQRQEDKQFQTLAVLSGIQFDFLATPVVCLHFT
jgi:hypothetical protein